MQKVCETIGLLLFTLLALAACTGRNPQTPKKSTQPQDTIYTQQAAMDIYDYDPVRALEIVDSAVIVGNLSDWQAFRQIGISAELHWGFIGVLHSDFKTVEQTLYPIYGTISMYYKIK